MDQSRDPNLNPAVFAERTAAFFSTYHLPPFTTGPDATSFVHIMDTIFDALTDQMKKTDSTYSAETIIIFGSPIGEAFCAIFMGSWHFSERQNRWVVQTRTVKGDPIEFNVFNKVEKRFVNGMEDSISHFLIGSANLVLAN
jgi:hypothetical protein